MIAKAMLKRASNELKQAFCAVDKDVQEAILKNVKYAECLQCGKGGDMWSGGFEETDIKHADAFAWRLSPDTPTEAEWAEFPIDVQRGAYCIESGTFDVSLWCSSVNAISIAAASAMVNFLGIWYTLNGIETMRTSVDAAFGTPVRVRFAKEETK